MWRRLISTHRQAQKMILGPRPTVKTRFLSFNRTQSRVVTNLLTGHNSLRRHLHFMGLSSTHLCRICWVEEGTSIHVLCKCEALTSIRHAYLVSFFLDQEDINSVSLAAICNFSKGAGLPWLDIRLWGTKGQSKGLGASGPKGLEPNYLLLIHILIGRCSNKKLPVRTLVHMGTDW